MFASNKGPKKLGPHVITKVKHSRVPWLSEIQTCDDCSSALEECYNNSHFMSAHNCLPFLKHLSVGLSVAMANLLDGCLLFSSIQVLR